MKFALDVPTAQEFANPRMLADLAAEAEQAGWDGFFIWDIMFNQGTTADAVIDPWIALSAIAMRTQRIRIGALLTPLPRRHPWTVARQTASLDVLSGGRLVFGAALGYQPLDFAPFGEDYDPRIRAEKLDESLHVLNSLWSGEEFSFQGRHYHVDRARFLPRPVQQPRIPIWVAAGWPRRKPLYRAAQWDGLYLMTVNQVTQQFLTPAEIRQIASIISEHRSSPASFDIAFNLWLPPNPTQAADAVRPYIEAGATWCITGGEESIEAYRTLIRTGPPRL